MLGLEEFLTAMAAATPGLLAAWAVWMFIKRDFRAHRDLRRRKRAVRERHITNQARIALMDVHNKPTPTLQERFDQAFHQAWIEPTLEIINRIDAECTPPEPNPYEADAKAFYADDFGKPTCVPCETPDTVPVEEYDRLLVRMQQQQEHIQALEARLKSVLDQSIERQLMYGSPIDTKRMFR